MCILFSFLCKIKSWRFLFLDSYKPVAEDISCEIFPASLWDISDLEAKVWRVHLMNFPRVPQGVSESIQISNPVCPTSKPVLSGDVTLSHLPSSLQGPGEACCVVCLVLGCSDCGFTPVLSSGLNNSHAIQSDFGWVPWNPIATNL